MTYTITDAIKFLESANAGRFRILTAEVYANLLRDLEDQHAARERAEREVAALRAELQTKLPEVQRAGPHRQRWIISTERNKWTAVDIDDELREPVAYVATKEQAFLVAAAPDLYTALEALLYRFNRHQDEAPINNEDDAAARTAVAALLKACGEGQL